MAIIKIHEAYVDTATGVVMVKQTDGSYDTYIKTSKVDGAFKAVGLANVCAGLVKNALNALIKHLGRTRV